MQSTPAPFRFDGHGINDANGQRVCKVTNCEPYIYPDGLPVRNSEFDRLSNLFAAAPDMHLTLKLLYNDFGHDYKGPTIDALKAVLEKVGY